MLTKLSTGLIKSFMKNIFLKEIIKFLLLYMLTVFRHYVYYIYVCTPIHTRKHMRHCTHTHINTHTFIYTCTHIHLSAYIHFTYAEANIFTYIYTYTNKHFVYKDEQNTTRWEQTMHRDKRTYMLIN